MEIRDPESIKKIKEARELVAELQRRLFQCEQALDDLARSAEIADITKQTHLMIPHTCTVCAEDHQLAHEL